MGLKDALLHGHAFCSERLAEELERIFNDDQKYRLMVDSAEKIYEKNSPQLDSLNKIIQSYDKKNLLRVAQLLEHGRGIATDLT